MNIISEIPPVREMSQEVAGATWARIERDIAAGTRRPQPVRWAARAGLGLAAAAAAGALLVVQPWSGGTAYASWTAVPDQVDATTLHSLGADCATKIHSHFKQAPDMRAVVGEMRGDFHAVLMGGGGSLSACVDIDSGELGGLTSASGTPEAGEVILDANPGLLTGPDAFRVAYGRFAAPAAKVVVQTTDGRSVTASTGDGYFMAWWPSGSAAHQVQAFDAQGALLSSVAAPQDPPTVPTHS